jgi:hypothetical protein
MITKELAAILQAKRSGVGWSAKCPAHPDRSPSLSIREGDDGRILLRCFAGCSIDSILSALGLSKRDLFAGPPPSKEQLATMRAAQEAREHSDRMERRARHDAILKAEKLQMAVNALGGKLARHPEDESLAATFHRACGLLHKAETTVDQLYTPKRRDRAQDRKTAA